MIILTNALLKNLLPLLLIITLLPACDRSGGKDSHEKATRDTVAAFKEFNDTLDDVTDESSASSAAPKINDTAKKIKAIAERIKSLPTPTKDEQKSLKDTYEPQINKQKDRLQANMERLKTNRAAMAQLRDPLFEVSAALFDLSWNVGPKPSARPSTPATPPSAFGQPPTGSRNTGPGIGSGPGNPSGRPGGLGGPGQPPMTFDDRVKAFIDQNGKDNVIKLEIKSLPDTYDRAKLTAHLKTLTNHTTWTAQNPKNGLNIYLAPVPDLSATAQKIDFGKVTNTDTSTRTITIEADPSKLP